MPSVLELKQTLPPEDLKKFAKELKELEALERKELVVLERKAQYKTKHGAEFFSPFWYQQKFIDYLHAGKKTVLLIGSNQTGKTKTGACMVESFCSGIQPWDGKKSIFGGRPTKGRIICTSWEAHAKETLIPKLKEELFIDNYETTKNNVGVEAFWKHKKTGSQFTIMCQTQETTTFESDTYDWAWSDEPLSRDKHTATCRGLIAREGIFMMTMTSLSQAWIYREIYQKMNDEEKKIGCVTNIKMRENKSLTEEAIKRFEDSIPEDERTARIEGGWLQLSGLVWPKFRRDVHVIKPFKIPPSWPVVVLIDPHWAMPFVVCYYAVSPLGRRYQIAEAWIPPNPKEVCYEIIRMKKENSWRLERCYIDPLAKGDTEITTQRFGAVDDIFTTMKKELNPFGILLDVAKRSESYKTSGIINVSTWLMEQWNEPSLFFFDTCPKSVEEIELWGKDKTGDPIDEDDHACENLYRFTLTNTRYTDPSERTKYRSKPVKGVV